MSVRSVGIDLLEVKRMERAIERWGERLLERVFTEEIPCLCVSALRTFAKFT